MYRRDDCMSLCRKVGNLAHHSPCSSAVQAAGWLVKDKDCGLLHQLDSQGEAAKLPCRQALSKNIADDCVRRLSESKGLKGPTRRA
jgi:hypothetical protein